MSATLISDTAPLDQAKRGRVTYRYGEAELRDAVDRWGRTRWPDARVCHELVMNRGTVRLDVAFVAPRHLAVVELKSGFDTMERAIHQVAMACLAADEVWLICDDRHDKDMKLIGYLLPQVGMARLDGSVGTIVIDQVAVPSVPHPDANAALLWVSELADALRIGGKTPGTHKKLAARFAALDADTRCALVCRALRGRDALWRADPPVRDPMP